MTIQNFSPTQTRMLIVGVLILLTVGGGFGIALSGGAFSAPDPARYRDLPVAGVAPPAQDLPDLDLIFVDPPAQGPALLILANRGQSELAWRMVGVGRDPGGRIGVIRVGVVGVNSFRLQALLRADAALAERFRFVDLGDGWYESVLDPFDMILVTEAGDGITPVEAEALAAYAATGRSVVMGIAGFTLPAESATRLAGLFGVTAAQSTAADVRAQQTLPAPRPVDHPVNAGVVDPALPEGAVASFAPNGARVVSAADDDTGDGGARGYVLARDRGGRTVLMGGNLAAWYAADPALVRNAIRWAGVTWVFLEPSAGTIPAGADAPLAADIDVTGFISGAHTANIFIRSNDPAQPQLLVPLALRVEGQAAVEVDAAELDFDTVFVGYAEAQTLRIRNTGSTDLIVGAVEIDHRGFVVEPAQLTVPVLGSATVQITYRPAVTETVSAQLTIRSNDPVSPTLQLPLAAAAEAAPAIALLEMAATQTLTVANAVIEVGAPVVFDPAVLEDLETPAVETATPVADVVATPSPTPNDIVAAPQATAVDVTETPTATVDITPTFDITPTVTATATVTVTATPAAQIPAVFAVAAAGSLRRTRRRCRCPRRRRRAEPLARPRS
ncbi:MAG: hypothetical protein R2873_30485 [Caldilineaceae bacterium]